MKYLTRYIPLAFCSLFSSAQAATIFEIQSDVSVYASSVSSSSGDYFDQTFSGDFSAPIDSTALSNAVTGSDLTTYAWSPEHHMPSGSEGAYIDLSFSDSIYAGDGADLVLFFAGNATALSTGLEKFLFSVDIGADQSIEGQSLSVITSTTSSIYGDAFFASYAIIDLELLGYDQIGPLGDIRIYMDDSSIPALSAVGAYHVAAVPLPLPAILFASGLGLLGLVGRRSKA